MLDCSFSDSQDCGPLLWYHSLPFSQTNLTFVDLCHQQHTFDPFSPNSRGDIVSQSCHILKRWSCIKTPSSSWKELYEVENRWRSVLLWEFIRNKTFPRGSVFSGAFCHGCREIHKGSEKWIQQVFDIIQFVNKKRWEHAARAGGDTWQMSKNPAADGGDLNGKRRAVLGWL